MPVTHVKGVTPHDVPAERNVCTTLWERAQARGSRPILRFWEHDEWRSLTWGELAARVEELAAGLIALRVKPGDRVALMSDTRYEWTVADLAILAAGAVTVPIYETSSVDQCAWILKDSGAVVALAGSADHAKNLDEARDEASKLRDIFVFDEDGLDKLAAKATDRHRGQVRTRSEAVTGKDLATIIYTSGTTGRPKGCMLTHGNFVWTTAQTQRSLGELFGQNDSTLLFLPLAHVFARLIQFATLELDTQLGYARSVQTLQEDLASFSPTFLLSVPRVFEKVFNGAQRKAGGGAKGKIFDFAVRVAHDWSEAVDAGRHPRLGTRIRHGIADKLVYSKLREAIGGRVAYAVSGGAPLAEHLARFFHAAGITILEGYGLTETTAPATVNTPRAMRIGTVGQPLPGVEVKIADDGEVLIRGGNVFQGYYRNDAATKETITDDGWFHSGDLGAIDDQGFVRITGRKKEIIVTAGGKNVAPAVLEERLKAHRLVSQAMAVGDNRPFVAALVTLDADELAAFAEEHGLAGTFAELSQAPQVQEEVSKAVAHANEAVSQAESIRKVALLERDFTQEEDEITPTLKLRRGTIANHFGDEIERLYKPSA